MENGAFNKTAPLAVERIEFFRSFLREPGRVGALAPSSDELAEAILEGCDLRNARAVVEFGPGTGSFTRLILERIGPETTFFALELGPEHLRGLRRRFPGLKVHNDCAEKVQDYLTRHRAPKADCIISGLPWANMPSSLQDRILRTTVAALKPNGVFTAFAYAHAFWLPRARSFRRRLETLFPEVTIGRIVWRNVPPALVYRCRLTGPASPGQKRP
jgi:phospholipid N-methyltransferase